VAPPICSTEGLSSVRADGSNAEAAKPDSERTADLLVNAILPPAAVSIVPARADFDTRTDGIFNTEEQPAAVPEPATIALGGIGLLAAAALRRRKIAR